MLACSDSWMINRQGLVTASGCSCNPRAIRAAPCRDCSNTPVIQNERTLCSNRVRFWFCKVDVGGSSGATLVCTLIGICVIGLFCGGRVAIGNGRGARSEEHTSELQSHHD